MACGRESALSTSLATPDAPPLTSPPSKPPRRIMMSSDLVLTTLDDGVLEITLNRPDKRNALSLELFEAVGEAFDRAADPAVRVVLLRANGPVFCAGIDLASLGGLAADPGEGVFLKGVAHLQDIYLRLE